MRINKLSAELANQIAAGEVIERPASVVKELLENAIDSGANRIDVEIDKGGKRLIRIRDNGCGIHEDDMPLVLARHATSKIRSFDDLSSILSLGFRGEALASIASVSHLTLSSRMPGHPSAWKAEAHGSEQEVKVIQTAHGDGTTVEIRDLFYNTPARRHFLRSDKTEFAQIEDTVKRLAFSRFDVGICLRHDHRLIFDLKPTHDMRGKEQRVGKLFGITFLKNSVYIEADVRGLQLCGWLGMPSFTRSQTDLQALYVNGRIVKDKVLNHAVRSSYENLVPEGRYPTFILFLNIDPSEVDVNVHPTKHEVRFRQTRLIHDFIVSALKDALSKAPKPDPIANLGMTHYTVDYSKQTPDSGNQNWHVAEPGKPYENRAETQYDNDISTLTEVVASPPEINKNPTTVLAFLHKQYLLVEQQQQYLLIDLICAIQYLAKVELIQALSGIAPASQALLFPVSVSLLPELMTTFEAKQAFLKTLGIDANCVSGNTILLRRLPNCLAHADHKTLFMLALTHLQKHDESQNEILCELIATKSLAEAKLFSLNELQQFGNLLAKSSQDFQTKNTWFSLLTAANLAKLL